MRLNANLAIPIVVLLFLGSMVELRDSVRDEWLVEQKPRTFRSHMFQAANTPGDSVAFPGAVGWGANAFQDCHDITDTVIVEKITSLSGDTSVAGTMANTLKHKQHGDTLTIITWDLGGWSAPIIWSGVGGYEGKLECVYLAMQTAPGGGVGYRRNQLFKINDDSYGFVIRGGTFAGDARSGEISPQFRIQDAQNFIVAETDHLWGEGEKMIYLAPSGSNDTVKSGTFMRNMFAQAQAVEATAWQITELDNTGTHLERISVYKPLFHTIGWRAPMIATNHLTGYADPDTTPRVRMVGPLWYNSGSQGLVTVRGMRVDVVDGYVKPGPFSNSSYDYAVGLDVDNERPDSATSLYVERLVGSNNRDTTTTEANLWAEGATQEVSCYRNVCDAAGGGDPRDSLGTDIRRTSAMSVGLPTFTLPRVNPFDLEEELAGTASDSGQVGAFRRIQCDGTWAMRSDSLHAALLGQVQDSTGVSSAPDSAYVAIRQQYTKATGSTCDDNDGDGIPKEYEDLMSDLSDSDATDRSSDSDGDGFPAALEYVNGTRSDTYTDSDGDEAGSAGTTYGNSRNAYLVPLVDVLDTLGTAPDTMILTRTVPDRDSVPLGYAYSSLRAAGRGSTIVLTYDTITEIGAGITDSSDVDSLMAAWGINQPPYPWSAPIPGTP